MSDGQIRTLMASDGGFDIVIDRPDAGNALTADMTVVLAAALTGLPDSAKYVVLRERRARNELRSAEEIRGGLQFQCGFGTFRHGRLMRQEEHHGRHS